MATANKKDSSKQGQTPAGSGGHGGGSGGGHDGAGYAADNIRLGGEAKSLFTKALGIGGVALVLSFVLGSMEDDHLRRFSLSYITAFTWMLAIGLGALFWVILQNLVNAHWSIVLRRVVELIAANAPVMALLALPIVVPIFMGNSAVYEWADAHASEEVKHHLHHKAAYLNSTFFFIRFVVYFGLWTFLSRYFLNNSLAQDQSGKADIVAKMRATAGPAMIGFALTMTFCAIDLLMSLDPIWFSTIFGVYYLASCILGVNAATALTAMWLQNKGRLTKSITVEHFHDLGKMIFAFTVFWTYIGFSQFMLIWYANMPEETAWYKIRFAGDWGNVSWVLLFGHFVIPFFGIVSRQIKRNKKTLAFWAIWQLVMIYVDMYWLVMPNVGGESLPLKLIDLTCWVGVLGVFIAGVAWRAQNVNLLPTKDPRLPKSLSFQNI